MSIGSRAPAVEYPRDLGLGPLRQTPCCMPLGKVLGLTEPQVCSSVKWGSRT